MATQDENLIDGEDAETKKVGYHCHYKGTCIDDGDCYDQCTSHARGLCKLETSPPINNADSDYTLPGICCCV
ncbi:hypothetical protein C5167_027262 [Papaver somniferum]|nr:hypothetical protein C5167_027262 [Papaver somniferum]